MSAPNHAKLFVGFVMILFVVGLGLNGDVLSNENAAGAATEQLRNYADPYDSNYQKLPVAVEPDRNLDKTIDGIPYALEPQMPESTFNARTKEPSQQKDGECIQLTQDNLYSHVQSYGNEPSYRQIYPYDCVELIEDIELGGNGLIVADATKLYCNDFWLLPDIELSHPFNSLPALTLQDSAQAYDCNIQLPSFELPYATFKHRELGIVLYDNTLFSSGRIEGQFNFGGLVKDSALLAHTEVEGFMSGGIQLGGNGIILNSVAKNGCHPMKTNGWGFFSVFGDDTYIEYTNATNITCGTGGSGFVSAFTHFTAYELYSANNAFAGLKTTSSSPLDIHDSVFEDNYYGFANEDYGATTASFTNVDFSGNGEGVHISPSSGLANLDFEETVICANDLDVSFSSLGSAIGSFAADNVQSTSPFSATVTSCPDCYNDGVCAVEYFSIGLSG